MTPRDLRILESIAERLREGEKKMSLSEAVVEIVKDMEDASAGHDAVAASFVERWVYALKMAVRASSGVKAYADGKIPVEPSPDPRLVGIAERAAKRLEDRKKEATVEEAFSGVAVCVGGASDGTMVPADGMPDGAHTLIGGEVYTLRQGRLTFDADLTDRARSRKPG